MRRLFKEFSRDNLHSDKKYILGMITELYLDTSDVVAMKALSRIFPLAGVTANPGIIAADKKLLDIVLPQPHETMGGRGRLFAQVMTATAERMVNGARKLCSIIADIMVKVPVTAEGLVAIKMLKTEGTLTLGTAIYGAAQGLLLALTSAEYVAPYASRIDVQGDSGIQAMTDLHQLLKMHTPQVRVLAANFKTPRQALDCLLTGCESIMLSLNVAQQMISYSTAEVAVAKLEQDWLEAFGRAPI